MNIKLRTAWISTTGGTATNAKLDIEGVGQQEIESPLPPALLAQVEAFFVNEYKDRLNKAMGEAA